MLAWYKIKCDQLFVSHCQRINISCRCPCSFNFHLVGKSAVIVIWRSSRPVVSIWFQGTKNTKVIYIKLLFLSDTLIGMTQFKQWRQGLGLIMYKPTVLKYAKYGGIYKGSTNIRLILTCRGRWGNVNRVIQKETHTHTHAHTETHSCVHAQIPQIHTSPSYINMYLCT